MQLSGGFEIKINCHSGHWQPGRSSWYNHPRRHVSQSLCVSIHRRSRIVTLTAERSHIETSTCITACIIYDHVYTSISFGNSYTPLLLYIVLCSLLACKKHSQSLNCWHSLDFLLLLRKLSNEKMSVDNLESRMVPSALRSCAYALCVGKNNA